MQITDCLYFLIPITNSVGNILLKVSVNRRAVKSFSWFVAVQCCSYGIFILVVAQSYLFLLQHEAKVFVIILALNYLATIYSSRWLLQETFSRQEVVSDIMLAGGIALFALGNQI